MSIVLPISKFQKVAFSWVSGTNVNPSCIVELVEDDNIGDLHWSTNADDESDELVSLDDDLEIFLFTFRSQQNDNA